MRKLLAAAFLAVLFVGCNNGITHEEANYEGYTTTDWIDRLHSEEIEVRRDAAKAMGELGPEEASSTVPALIQSLKDEDTLVRLYSIRSLSKLGPVKSRSASAAVGRAINDKDKRVAKEAIKLYKEIELAKPSAINGH
jgi:HEAT repeat protein